MFFISLILSSIIAVLALFVTYTKQNRDSQGIYGIKVFTISFITIIVGLYFLMTPKQDLEIDIGEANF